MSSHPDPRADAVIVFFEKLQASDVAWLGRLYTEQAFFKDPFNEVNGLAGVQRVFAHMFATLDAPRFRVLDALVEGRAMLSDLGFHVPHEGAVDRAPHPRQQPSALRP